MGTASLPLHQLVIVLAGKAHPVAYTKTMAGAHSTIGASLPLVCTKKVLAVARSRQIFMHVKEHYNGCALTGVVRTTEAIC